MEILIPHDCAPWGLGTFTFFDEFGSEQSCYGFAPTGLDPRDFIPDKSSCWSKEIAAHKAACEEWDKKHGKKEE